MSNAQLIEALHLARSGDWTGAHNIIQNIDSKEAARIHGYLHRAEGDNGNARYWYHRAGTNFPNVSLDEEWNQIHDELL